MMDVDNQEGQRTARDNRTQKRALKAVGKRNSEVKD
jgi:hypothetical protein